MDEKNLYEEKYLLQLVAAGNEQAFRQLYDKYRRGLFTYVFKITESIEIAEDTIQEIFLNLWIKRTSLPEIENINAYLYRMAHNSTYHGFKRLAKETLLIAHLKNEQDVAAGLLPEQQLISKEVAAFIRSVVDRFTPQQRKVFLLSREQGLKQQEIAQKLNISLFTVKKHMVDALHYLREEVKKNYGSKAIALYVIFQLGLP